MEHKGQEDEGRDVALLEHLILDNLDLECLEAIPLR